MINKLKKDTPINEVKALFCELLSEYVDYRKICTDGSKSDVSVGYGVSS